MNQIEKMEVLRIVADFMRLGISSTTESKEDIRDCVYFGTEKLLGYNLTHNYDDVKGVTEFIHKQVTEKDLNLQRLLLRLAEMWVSVVAYEIEDEVWPEK